VLLDVAVLVGVSLAVTVAVGVLLEVAVAVGVLLGVVVSVGVLLEVAVLVGVLLDVTVAVGVLLDVAVAVAVNVWVGVGVLVAGGVIVALMPPDAVLNATFTAPFRCAVVPSPSWPSLLYCPLHHTSRFVMARIPHCDDVPTLIDVNLYSGAPSSWRCIVALVAFAKL
jgi:hypothetical protein